MITHKRNHTTNAPNHQKQTRRNGIGLRNKIINHYLADFTFSPYCNQTNQDNCGWDEDTRTDDRTNNDWDPAKEPHLLPKNNRF